MARRLSFLALKLQILSRDQCSAIPRRSATDITTAMSCNIQDAWSKKEVAGMVTVDVKGAFDGIQKGRLCHYLRGQGWPPNVV